MSLKQAIFVHLLCIHQPSPINKNKRLKSLIHLIHTFAFAQIFCILQMKLLPIQGIPSSMPSGGQQRESPLFLPLLACQKQGHLLILPHFLKDIQLMVSWSSLMNIVFGSGGDGFPPNHLSWGVRYPERLEAFLAR